MISTASVARRRSSALPATIVALLAVELAGLLGRVQRIALIDADARLRTIHHDWSGAAERTQQTVRLISELLRRFPDDQVRLVDRTRTRYRLPDARHPVTTSGPVDREPEARAAGRPP